MSRILKNLVSVAALLFLAYYAYGEHMAKQPVGHRLAAGNEVVMYSLTTCGYCKQTRGYLQAAGIPFTEHFLDTDAARRDEFFQLLADAGVPGGGVGTPSLVVNGALLVNNPDMKIIKQHLRYRS